MTAAAATLAAEQVDHVEHFPWGCIVCLVTGVERCVTPAEAEAIERKMEEVTQ